MFFLCFFYQKIYLGNAQRFSEVSFQLIMESLPSFQSHTKKRFKVKFLKEGQHSGLYLLVKILKTTLMIISLFIKVYVRKVELFGCGCRKYKFIACQSLSQNRCITKQIIYIYHRSALPN